MSSALNNNNNGAALNTHHTNSFSRYSYKAEHHQFIAPSVPLGIHIPIPEIDADRHILAERFKTKVCRNYVAQGFCPYESRCMFAHGEHDVRTYEENIRDGLYTEEAIKGYKRAHRMLQQQQQRYPSLAQQVPHHQYNNQQYHADASMSLPPPPAYNYNSEHLPASSSSTSPPPPSYNVSYNYNNYYGENQYHVQDPSSPCFDQMNYVHQETYYMTQQNSMEEEEAVAEAAGNSNSNNVDNDDNNSLAGSSCYDCAECEEYENEQHQQNATATASVPLPPPPPQQVYRHNPYSSANAAATSKFVGAMPIMTAHAMP